MTGLNITVFRTLPDFWRDIFRNRRDASRGTVNIYIRRLSIMSVRYCVEMSVGYAIRMSAQVADGDPGFLFDLLIFFKNCIDFFGVWVYHYSRHEGWFMVL